VSSNTQQHAEPNYWYVWLALLILTVVELGVARAPMPKAAMVFLLCVLALAKAALVAMYFMHLKFEPFPLMLIVVTPLVLSALLYIGLVPDAISHIHWLPQ